MDYFLRLARCCIIPVSPVWRRWLAAESTHVDWPRRRPVLLRVGYGRRRRNRERVLVHIGLRVSHAWRDRNLRSFRDKHWASVGLFRQDQLLGVSRASTLCVSVVAVARPVGHCTGCDASDCFRGVSCAFAREFRNTRAPNAAGEACLTRAARTSGSGRRVIQ